MTARQYLLQIRKLNYNLYVLGEEIELRRAKLTSTSAPIGGERVQPSPDDKFATMIAALADKELQQAEQVIIYQALRDRIVDQILDMQNELQQKVLYERYVNMLDWRTIAKKLAYSEQYLWRVHGNALTAFAKKYPDSLR